MTFNVALIGGGPASGHRGLHVGDRPVTQGPGVERVPCGQEASDFDQSAGATSVSGRVENGFIHCCY